MTSLDGYWTDGQTLYEFLLCTVRYRATQAIHRVVLLDCLTDERVVLDRSDFDMHFTPVLRVPDALPEGFTA